MKEAVKIEQQQREKALFFEAYEIEGAAERSRFLDSVCDGDVQLRQRLNQLLAESGEEEEELVEALSNEREMLALEISNEKKWMSHLGGEVDVLGDYDLLEEIGRGAMGVVFRARQRTLDREVALKIVISAALSSDSDRERFQIEARSAAQLEHPNIVPIYEIGIHEEHDYYSMPWIRGGTLEQRMEAQPYSYRAAVELMVPIALAVQAAHQRGVIHRDLKPANILLDEQGVPMVSDFGLARWLDCESNLTLSGQIMGTPKYMAPEMAEGNGAQVSTASDVYALGAILYELLTKQPPFQADTLLTMLRAIRDDVAPSLRSHDDSIDRDLDTIVLKCLEKGQADRYRSAGALADDLQAWLDHRPIAARPPSTRERVTKWVQRRPYQAALLVLGFLFLLVLGLGGPIVGMKQSILRQQAEAAREDSDQAREDAMVSESLARKQAHANRRLAYTANMRLISMLNRYREVTGRLAPEMMISRWLPRDGEQDDRSWEWYYTYGEIHQRERFFSVPGGARSLQFSSFGEWILYSGSEGSGYRHTLTTALDRVFKDGEGHLVSQWNSNGARIATVSDTGVVKIWNTKTGDIVNVLPQHSQYRAISWGASPDFCAALSNSGKIEIWDISKENEPSLMKRSSRAIERLKQIEWSPDGKYLAASGDYNEVFVWIVDDLSSEPQKLEGHRENVTKIRWQRDSNWLVSGSKKGVVRVFGMIGAQRVVRVSSEGNGPIASLAWNPDGGEFAYVPESEGRILLTNVMTSANAPIKAFAGKPTAMDWTAEAHTIALGTNDGKVLLFRWGLPKVESLALKTNDSLRSVHWNQEGTTVACLTERNEFIKVNLLTRKASPPRRLLEIDDRTPLAWNPGSGALAIGVRGQGGEQIKILKDGKDKEKQPVALTLKRLSQLHWMNRQELIACSEKGELEVVATRPVKDKLRFDRPSVGTQTKYKALSTSPDGSYVLASGDQQRLTLWSVGTGAILYDRSSPRSQLDEKLHAWDSKGKVVVTANGDGQITFWDIQSGLKKMSKVQAHKGPVVDMVAHPHVERLATCGEDQTIRIWDTKTGLVTLTLEGHRGGVRGLAWGPEGRRLASVGQDGTLRIWDATAGMLLSGK